MACILANFLTFLENTINLYSWLRALTTDNYLIRHKMISSRVSDLLSVSVESLLCAVDIRWVKGFVSLVVALFFFSLFVLSIYLFFSPFTLSVYILFLCRVIFLSQFQLMNKRLPSFRKLRKLVQESTISLSALKLTKEGAKYVRA